MNEIYDWTLIFQEIVDNNKTLVLNAFNASDLIGKKLDIEKAFKAALSALPNTRVLVTQSSTPTTPASINAVPAAERTTTYKDLLDLLLGIFPYEIYCNRMPAARACHTRVTYEGPQYRSGCHLFRCLCSRMAITNFNLTQNGHSTYSTLKTVFVTTQQTAQQPTSPTPPAVPVVPPTSPTPPAVASIRRATLRGDWIAVWVGNPDIKLWHDCGGQIQYNQKSSLLTSRLAAFDCAVCQKRWMTSMIGLGPDPSHPSSLHFFAPYVTTELLPNTTVVASGVRVPTKADWADININGFTNIQIYCTQGTCNSTQFSFHPAGTQLFNRHLLTCNANSAHNRNLEVNLSPVNPQYYDANYMVARTLRPQGPIPNPPSIPYPNSPNSPFASQNINKEISDRCECGSYKALGIGKGQIGHSSYCPWR